MNRKMHIAFLLALLLLAAAPGALARPADDAAVTAALTAAANAISDAASDISSDIASDISSDISSDIASGTAAEPPVAPEEAAFACPEMDFITEITSIDFSYDPDAPVMDASGAPCLTLREQAECALKFLHAFCGWLPERCVVIYDGFDFLFGHTDPWFDGTPGEAYDGFFQARIDPTSGLCTGFWFHPGAGYAPAVEDLRLPEGAEDMRYEELALYFYECSGLGGDVIERVEPSHIDWGDGGVHLNLVLEDGRFYEVNFWDPDIRIPQRMWGVYEEGYLH